MADGHSLWRRFAGILPPAINVLASADLARGKPHSDDADYVSNPQMRSSSSVSNWSLQPARRAVGLEVLNIG